MPAPFCSALPGGCIRQAGDCLEILDVPSAFRWVPWDGWNLGSQEGPGEEDPVTALLTPVRCSEGFSYSGNLQAKVGGGGLWNHVALGLNPTLLLTSLGQ